MPSSPAEESRAHAGNINTGRGSGHHAGVIATTKAAGRKPCGFVLECCLVGPNACESLLVPLVQADSSAALSYLSCRSGKRLLPLYCSICPFTHFRYVARFCPYLSASGQNRGSGFPQLLFLLAGAWFKSNVFLGSLRYRMLLVRQLRFAPTVGACVQMRFWVLERLSLDRNYRAVSSDCVKGRTKKLSAVLPDANQPCPSTGTSTRLEYFDLLGLIADGIIASCTRSATKECGSAGSE